MKNNILTISLVFALIFVSSFSGYSFAPQKIEGKEKFSPESVKSFSQLIGDWEADVHGEIGPIVSARDLKLSMSMKKIFDGNVIQFESKSQIVGESKASNSYGIIAYDTTDKQFYFMLYTDSCLVFNLTGNWMNQYNLNFSGSANRNGKKVKLTLYFGFKNPEHVDYTLYTTVDNTLISDTGKLKRKAKSGK